MIAKEQPLRDALKLKGSARNAQENTLRSLIGLALMWAALFLTFLAHQKSESVLRLSGGDSVAEAALKPPVNEALDPIFKLMLPLKLKQLHTSPRQMIRNVSDLLGMEMAESSLSMVDDSPRDAAFDDVPAYRVLHQLIDGGSEKYGLAVSGNRLRVIDQKVSTVHESRDQWVLQWEAERPLETKPLAVAPSADSNLWFSVALTGPVEVDASQWNRVRLAIWRGGEELNVSTATIDDRGRADIKQTSQGERMFSIAFSLEQIDPDSVPSAAKYKMKLQYREMTPKGA